MTLIEIKENSERSRYPQNQTILSDILVDDAMTRSHDGRRGKKPTRFQVVGHDAIDADHEAIFKCCDEIASSSSIALEMQLHRLRALLVSHFQHEELLLKQAKSRLCGCHTRDHELFLEFCDKSIQVNRQNDHSSRKLILQELLPALREHIAYRDQLIALHLNSLLNAPIPHDRGDK